MAYRKEIEELGLKNAVSCVVGRHASAELDIKNREQVRGYIYYPDYDPGLSQKGKDSMPAVVAKMPGVHEWHSSPAERAMQTTKYFCSDVHDLPVEEKAFGPSNPSGITDDVVDKWMETFNDDLLLDAYITSGEFVADQALALQRLLELIKKADTSYAGKNIPFGIITHNEIGRLIKAWCDGLPIKEFVTDKCDIAKGSFVIITFHPNGNIVVKRSN